MAELLIGLTQLTAGSLEARPLREEEHDVADEPLPPPIIPGNYDKRAASCLMNVRGVVGLFGGRAEGGRGRGREGGEYMASC